MKNFVLAVTFVLFAQALIAQDYKSVEQAKGIAVGDEVADFTAMDANGKAINLYGLLDSKPVVILFYRGHWCPICNRHLGQIQDSLKMITDLGVSVIAISPEKPENLQKTERKTGAEFSLLYDEGYSIANAFDVAFEPQGSVTMKYNTFLNDDLKDAHSDESQRLPIPATFIINKEHKVVWRQFDPNYKNRSSVFDIVEVLK